MPGSVLDSLYITRWGDAGAPVLMIHGGGQGSTSAGEANFSAQQPLSEQGWRLIVPDRPGHGRSPNPGHGDDPSLDAEWVAELIGDGAHVVAHSFGGLLALAGAELRPGAVWSLTLIEPALHKVASHRPVVRQFNLRMLRAILFSFSGKTRSARLMKLLGIPAQMARSPEEMKAMGEGMKRVRFPSKATLERQLAVIKAAGIPFMTISGGWSPTFDAVCEVAAELGGGKMVTARSEHHFPQWNGLAFNALLAKFWREAETARAAKATAK